MGLCLAGAGSTPTPGAEGSGYFGAMRSIRLKMLGVGCGWLMLATQKGSPHGREGQEADVAEAAVDAGAAGDAVGVRGETGGVRRDERVVELVGLRAEQDLGAVVERPVDGVRVTVLRRLLVVAGERVRVRTVAGLHVQRAHVPRPEAHRRDGLGAQLVSRPDLLAAAERAGAHPPRLPRAAASGSRAPRAHGSDARAVDLLGLREREAQVDIGRVAGERDGSGVELPLAGAGAAAGARASRGGRARGRHGRDQLPTRRPRCWQWPSCPTRRRRHRAGRGAADAVSVAGEGDEERDRQERAKQAIGHGHS